MAAKRNRQQTTTSGGSNGGGNGSDTHAAGGDAPVSAPASRGGNSRSGWKRPPTLKNIDRRLSEIDKQRNVARETIDRLDAEEKKLKTARQHAEALAKLMAGDDGDTETPPADEPATTPGDDDDNGECEDAAA